MSAKLQSVELTNSNGVRINANLENGRLVSEYPGGCKTLADSLLYKFEEKKNKPCLGERPAAGKPYEYNTYNEMVNEAKLMGQNIAAIADWPIGADKIVGIYAKNQPRWTVLAQSCILSNHIMVPVYATLGREACIHIFNQTEMPIVFCGSLSIIKSLLKELENMPHLKTIVLMDSVEATNEEYTSLKEKYTSKVKLTSYDAIRDLYPANSKELTRHPEPNDLALICYTSGTTGKPKGVMLTHDNLLATVVASQNVIDSNEELTVFSYLPMAHIFEQVVQIVCLYYGGKIGYIFGEVSEIFEDLKDVKPTWFPAVPRIITRLFDVYMGAKKPNWTEEDENKFLEMLRLRFGGKVTHAVVGGAPMPKDVMAFLRRMMKAIIIEGYGQTESAGAITFTLPSETEGGIVGPPHVLNYAKLVDVPDMNLVVSRDGRGEICAKGRNCTQGYYKSPELTAGLLDEQNWLHTGDVGEWTENGALRVVDRCKHIFKLAQGEYLIPERVEVAYLRCPLIEQVFVDGNSTQTNPVALVKPHDLVKAKYTSKAEAEYLAANEGASESEKEAGKKAASVEAMKQLKKDILADLKKLGEKAQLKGFEQVKVIGFVDVAYSIENGMLTPTMKSVRPVIRKFFNKDLEKLYSEMEALNAK